MILGCMFITNTAYIISAFDLKFTMTVATLSRRNNMNPNS